MGRTGMHIFSNVGFHSLIYHASFPCTCTIQLMTYKRSLINNNCSIVIKMIRTDVSTYICRANDFLPITHWIVFHLQISRLYLLLTVKESAIDVPTNLEARRRISFFANSLFMDMPRAPRVRKMLSFR